MIKEINAINYAKSKEKILTSLRTAATMKITRNIIVNLCPSFCERGKIKG